MTLFIWQFILFEIEYITVNFTRSVGLAKNIQIKGIEIKDMRKISIRKAINLQYQKCICSRVRLMNIFDFATNRN